MNRFFIEFVIVVIGIVFVHQVCWPLAMGRKMFPLFRREHKLKAELSEVRQELHEEDLAEELERERNKLSK